MCNLQVTLLFSCLFEVTPYFYKASPYLKLHDVTRRIVDLLVAITDAD